VWGDLKETNPALFVQKEIEHLEALMSSQEAHLRHSLEHIVKARRKLVIFILDNVDQQPEAFQEQVFLIAQAFADTWPASVFLSLRPDTFHRSRRIGALQAYQPRAFTISPPRVDRVIVRRLEYGRRQIKAHGRLPTFPPNVTLRVTASIRICRSLQRASVTAIS
jgi:hypothetical protein